MDRIIVIAFVFGGIFLAIHGLTEEVENMINLQQNIEEILGDQ
jgi:hypothetical protein